VAVAAAELLDPALDVQHALAAGPPGVLAEEISTSTTGYSRPSVQRTVRGLDRVERVRTAVPVALSRKMTGW